MLPVSPLPGPSRPSRAPASPLLPVLLVPLLVTVLVAGLVGGPGPAAGAEPRPGSAGIGDRYFPRDGNGGIDVRHYDVRVRYDFATGRLVGRTTLRLRATRALSRFNLDLLLPVHGVRVAGAPARFRKPHPHELQVTPRRSLAAGRTVRVVVRYAGRPATLRYAGERNWLADRREVVTMNQPHMAPWWFPANDHPRDKATLSVAVTVPRAKRVISNGTLVGRRVHGDQATTRWRSAEPMAPYLAFFAAGPFQVAHGVHRGLPWYAAVSRQLPARARVRAMRLMRRSAPITAWAASVLGEYPFSSTGGLTTALDVGFALENQTRPTYPALGDGVPVVVHEIAHQWFGNSVSLWGWRDIWLNEGAASFLEVYWEEDTAGRPAQDWLTSTYDLYPVEDSLWRVRLDDPGPSRIFHEAIYLRGAMVFQALRHRIGDADFRALLRTWVAQRRHGHGTTEQFTALAERISGEDLDGFFDAWLSTARRPERTAANGF